MTREMKLMIWVFDAVCTDEQRVTFTKMLKGLSRKPTSAAAADDVRLMLDAFAGTVTTRRDPTPVPDPSAEHRRKDLRALLDELKALAGAPEAASRFERLLAGLEG